MAHAAAQATDLRVLQHGLSEVRRLGTEWWQRKMLYSTMNFRRLAIRDIQTKVDKAGSLNSPFQGLAAKKVAVKHF